MGERKFNLSDKVVDIQTGCTGMIVAIHLYATDETNYTVQLPLAADGKIGEMYTFAERRLKKVEVTDAKSV